MNKFRNSINPLSTPNFLKFQLKTLLDQKIVDSEPVPYKFAKTFFRLNILLNLVRVN